MKRLVERLLKDEQGLELSEYAVMAALIILAIVLALTSLSGAIAGVFNQIVNTIRTATE